MVKNKTNIKKSILNIILIIIFNIILFTSMLLYTPFFKNARKVYVGSAITSTHYQYLATSFLSKEKINSILKEKIDDKQFDSNTNVVTLKNDKNNNVDFFSVSNENFDVDVIVVSNPKRVKVAHSKENGTILQELSEVIKDNNAEMGINAGGIQCRGNAPIGIVMSEGKLIYPRDEKQINPNDELDICAIDKDGILIVGKYTYKQMLSLHINEAVCFGPAIIKDGKALDIDGQGIRPRTVIGQKADGSILLGITRATSLLGIGGCSSEELKSLMLKLGAVNATNLDGGRASCMYKDGKYVYNEGKRQLATAIIVK